MTDFLKAYQGRKQSERGDVLQTMLILVTFVIIVVAAASVLWSSFNDAAEAQKANEDVAVEETVPAEPVSAQPSEPVDIPWEIFGVVLATLVGLVVLSVGGFHAYKAANKTIHHKKQQENTFAQNLLSWANTFKNHDDLLSEWGQYELDVEKLIRYPSLTDVSVPSTKTLMEALRQADLSRPTQGDKYTDASETAYGKAVAGLATALAAAVAQAKKQAWSNFTSKEQSRLNTALQMLQLAQNTGASINERQSAYKRVLAEVEGLIVLPEKPVALLEAAVLKEITPAPFNTAEPVLS